MKFVDQLLLLVYMVYFKGVPRDFMTRDNLSLILTSYIFR